MPAEIAKAIVSSSNDIDILSLPINGQETRRATVRRMRGKVFVDIREHYFDKDGTCKPGKKGLCMPIEQFEKILELGQQIKEAVASASS
jgi:hypothetical protein